MTHMTSCVTFDGVALSGVTLSCVTSRGKGVEGSKRGNRKTKGQRKKIYSVMCVMCYFQAGNFCHVLLCHVLVQTP